MNQTARTTVPCTLTLIVALLLAGVRGDTRELNDDYYFGFSQGAYYGLMLAGEEYDVAWCMKSELEYAASSLGAGGEFQKKMESMLRTCREEQANRQ
jgi:hypothetical protein